jgi:hypothetical protein
MSSAECELCSECHKYINSILDKNKELPQQWNEFIIVSIHEKSDKSTYSNYEGVLDLSTYI